MTEKIASTLKQKISELVLQPDSGGCFEVTVDGNLVYSKLQTGQFPDEQSIVDQLTSMSAA